MKRMYALTIIIVLIFALTACGGDSGDSSDGSSGGSDTAAVQAKEWPVDDYIPQGIEYDGKGEIVVVADYENGDIKGTNVFIKGATLEDVEAYAARLLQKGIVSDSSDLENIEDMQYLWAGTYGDSFFINLDFTKETQTTVDVVDDEMVDVEYNFHIAMGNNPV